MLLDDGVSKTNIWLDSPRKGVLIDPMVWHEMHEFSENCVMLVLASDHYDESDYIRDYQEFKRSSGMRLESKTIRLRLVEESDAEFILKLRLDERYNKYISEVNPDVDAQRAWIRGYKKEELEGKQFYFVIEKLDGTPCGTVRVYDLREDSFCWGSWILNENKTRFSALESAFLVYKFGFDVLGYRKSHFEVMNGNEKVVSFHEKMGAIRTGQDDVNSYFEITKISVDDVRAKLLEKIE
jgi:RimJ/RimL family protein N-acetyltransferase